MSKLAAMTQAVDFVEDHLLEDVSVADMADAVSYSLYHFCRLFSQVVHHTPYDYLMRRRLSEAARVLAATDQRIIDVAFRYRFSSPETFSRAFKRMFGIQPNRWRKEQRLDERELLNRVTAAHILHVNKGPYLKPALRQRDALHVAGLMTLVQDDAEAISRLWRILALQLQNQNATTAGHYGITWYPEQGSETKLYMAAVELAPAALVSPSPLVVKAIPATQYACFTHKGTYEELRLTRSYVYGTWFPQAEARVGASLEVECYGTAMPGAGGIAWKDDQAEWGFCIPVV